MSAIKLVVDTSRYPQVIREHVAERMELRSFNYAMNQEFWRWMHTSPWVPSYTDNNKGWHKEFKDFSIRGAGEFVRTLGTVSDPINIRQGSWDLDDWTREREEWLHGRLGGPSKFRFKARFLQPTN